LDDVDVVLDLLRLVDQGADALDGVVEQLVRLEGVEGKVEERRSPDRLSCDPTGREPGSETGQDLALEIRVDAFVGALFGMCSIAQHT
jgi:hypothetical protein